MAQPTGKSCIRFLCFHNHDRFILFLFAAPSISISTSRCRVFMIGAVFGVDRIHSGFGWSSLAMSLPILSANYTQS